MKLVVIAAVHLDNKFEEEKISVVDFVLLKLVNTIFTFIHASLYFSISHSLTVHLILSHTL